MNYLDKRVSVFLFFCKCFVNLEGCLSKEKYLLITNIECFILILKLLEGISILIEILWKYYNFKKKKNKQIMNLYLSSIIVRI